MTAPSLEVRELADAIREALNVPVADTRNPGGEHAEDMLRLKRVGYVRGILCLLADGTGSVVDTTRMIREAVTEFPVTYTVRLKAEVPS